MAGRFEQPFGKLLPRGRMLRTLNVDGDAQLRGMVGKQACRPSRSTWKSSGLLKALRPARRELITLRTCQAARRDLARQSRLPAAESRLPGIVGSVVCFSWRKHATFRLGGRGRSGVCDTCMAGLIGGSICTNPSHSKNRLRGMGWWCCSQPDEDVRLDL